MATDAPGEIIYVNATLSSKTVCEQLGFGGLGLGRPNRTDGVRNSGWRDVTIDFSIRNADWLQMGAMALRTGLPGSIDSPSGDYGCVPTMEEILAAWGTNMGMNIHWGNTPANDPPMPISPISGKAQFKRVQLLVWV